MKKLKNNIAELILATLTVAALSSCSSFNNKAEAQEYPSYNLNTYDYSEQTDYYNSLDCENCDEID